jgi:hypothetical protein
LLFRIRQGDAIALALQNIAHFAFEGSVATSAMFCFMLAHRVKIKNSIDPFSGWSIGGCLWLPVRVIARQSCELANFRKISNVFSRYFHPAFSLAHPTKA